MVLILKTEVQCVACARGFNNIIGLVFITFILDVLELSYFRKRDKERHVNRRLSKKRAVNQYVNNLLLLLYYK